jgi:hypothetical protein
MFNASPDRSRRAMMEEAGTSHKWRAPKHRGRERARTKKDRRANRARQSFADHGDRQSPSRGEHADGKRAFREDTQPDAISSTAYVSGPSRDQRATSHDCHAGSLLRQSAQ